MILSLFAVLQVFIWSARAASSNSIVCVAGQCLQGASNTTLGVTLSASDVGSSVLLLPGQYTATTNPQLIHDLLTSSHASLSASPGFANASTSSLPLNVAVAPGLAIYSSSLYSGKAAFSSLPSGPVNQNGASTPLSAGSMALAASTWAALSFGDNGRVVVWDSIPDVAQLPSRVAGAMSLLDMQSSTCSSPCASSGTCSSSGACTCAPGFSGTACETCAPGFFGPSCQACPAGCASCDEGISGTGRCLSPPVQNPLTACNCLNGQCNADGSCACNPGYTTAANGTSCAKCQAGFFATAAGDCKVCQLGCSSCADNTGDCLTCAPHFTQDQNDATKCTIVPSTAGGQTCPDGSFGDGGATSTCKPCSGSCATCSGATSNDCTSCRTLNFLTNSGSCVSASNVGVCDGSQLIADNTKHVCDTCGAKCTTCEIASFSVASTANQLKCTGCIKGSVLSNGQCIESCPSGTFLSPTDNVTCSTCDSSCSTCSGSSTTCLSCPNGQLAANGKCVSTCPSNTFSSSGACLSCHPDCATCTGSSFNQCATCPSNRPVLSSGRCLPTCSKQQFFDTSSGSCQSCDASCSSCSAAGASSCLACASSSQVLHGGTCVAAACNNGTSVVPGLGVCLSDLVLATDASANNGTISQPTTPDSTSHSRPLAWWEILLMALGCAFIFLLVLMCWRRRARKQRAKRTALFAQSENLGDKTGWTWRMLRFGEKLFGHHKSRRAQLSSQQQPSTTEAEVESEAIKLMKIRNAEEARHHREMEKLEVFGAYEYSRRTLSRRSSLSGRSRTSYAPSAFPPLDSSSHSVVEKMSRGSLYSQMTGVPRNTPEPRQPVSKTLLANLQRYPSTVSMGSSIGNRSYMFTAPEAPPPVPPKEGKLVDFDDVHFEFAPSPTEAQEYADAVRPSLAHSTSEPALHTQTHTQGAYWLQPHVTGSTSDTQLSSNNPFRR